MGCGTSSNVMPISDSSPPKPEGMANGMNGKSDVKPDDNGDDVPTEVLPEPPMQRKPPLAFEIPFKDEHQDPEQIPAPPPRIQKLIEKQSDSPTLTLPDIEEKLNEAESRRQTIILLRAASASKRAQKAVRVFSDMDNVKKELDLIENIGSECKQSVENSTKMFSTTTTLKANNEDKNI